LKTTSNYLFLSPRLLPRFGWCIPLCWLWLFNPWPFTWTRKLSSRDKAGKNDLPIEQNELYWHYWNRILFDLEYQSRFKM